MNIGSNGYNKLRGQEVRRHTAFDVICLPGDSGHIAGGILDGDDGLVLLSKHNPTVQEGRDDVGHQKMNLEIKTNKSVFVQTRPERYQYKLTTDLILNMRIQ